MVPFISVYFPGSSNKEVKLSLDANQQEISGIGEPRANYLRHIGIHSTPSENTKEIKMNIKKIASIFAAVAIVTSLISSPANALGKPKAQQVITWGWEDGGDKGHRDFSEDDYDTIGDMPSVKVTILPATVGRRVILETLNPGTKTWSAEQISRTDSDGIALLKVNPFCEEDASSTSMWCDHDSTYRIRVLKSGTQRQSLSNPFVVSFVTTEIDTI